MSLNQRLSEDLIKAQKSGNKEALSVIRMIRASVKNKEIEKKDSLSDEEIYGVLTSLVRQGKDSIEQFSRGGRQELAEKEEREISIIQSYLPEQLDGEEIGKIIKEVIEEVGAEGQKEMGMVMKAVMQRVKGRVDGKLVSGLVKKALSNDT